MDFKIAVLAGDGIGPEISVQGVDVMNAVCEKFGHKVSYEYAICGADAIDKVGDPFPEMTFQACKNADAVLFSAVGDPKFDNDPTAKVRPEQGLLAMRKKLGLFANIRPVQTFKCLVHKSPLRAELVENADFICIRELTGGMYFGEKYQDNDKAYDTNMYTRPEIERILKVAFEYAICGADAIDKVGDPFPEMTFQACKNADAVLFSAVGDPKFDNDPTAKVRPEQGLLAMRKKLGLFANIRPVQTFKCLVHKSPLRAELVENADFICIRELTGGMYFGEKYQDNDKAYDTNMYTRPEIERILKVAFEYAMKRRKHLTVVDKANVLASSRLWRQIAQEMAPQYPEVTTDYMFVDNAAMKMLQDPCFFDVMVTENTFGDILTDEGSVISGSMGLLPSASTGESTPVFEPIHGSWPQAKGLNIANPLAQILSVAMLFEYFDLKEEGALIRKAVDASLDENVRTPEIQVEGGAKYGTREVGAWIVDYIKKA